MNCSVCQKELVHDLSICFNCGTMKGDSVREELAVKVTSAIRQQPLMPPPPIPPPPIPQFVPPAISETMSKANLKMPSLNPSAAPQKEFAAAPPMPQTPNLVEFQPKNAALPEWRLQLQNSVRKRSEAKNSKNERPTIAAAPSIEEIAESRLEIEDSPPVQHQNKTVRSALERIEKSRRHFIKETANEVEIASEPEIIAAETEPRKEYKFHLAANNPNQPSVRTATKNPALRPPKPHLVTEETVRRRKIGI